MKILLISTTIFPLPPAGYAGTEQIVYNLAIGLQKKGHAVTVVAPEGTVLPEGIALIPTGLREPEEAAWMRYRDRLGEFDVIHSHGFEGWAYMSSAGRSPELPIIHTLHTVPQIYATPPPCAVPLLRGTLRAALPGHPPASRHRCEEVFQWH